MLFANSFDRYFSSSRNSKSIAEESDRLPNTFRMVIHSPMAKIRLCRFKAVEPFMNLDIIIGLTAESFGRRDRVIVVFGHF
ncbi:MAG: hypothetical protein SV375_21340 [Thermodesulfobacteriota bacterium]|nr:hypothetical protein [Thermodesulfobacteriota bacterium]